jgi:hypothetical protein
MRPSSRGGGAPIRPSPSYEGSGGESRQVDESDGGAEQDLFLIPS